MQKPWRQPGHHMLKNKNCSLILRLWQIENPNEGDWRASIEIPEAGKRIGFSSLEQLFAFLINFTEIDCDPRKMEANRKELHNI